MVFYKKEYGDPKGALEHKDGLAVLAFFYEVNDFLFTSIIITRDFNTINFRLIVIDIQRMIS